MSKSNLAIVEGEETEFKDNDGSERGSLQIIIDIADNGYVVTKSDTDLIVSQRVYLFEEKGEYGAKTMIQDLIYDLGLADKVKLK